MAKIIVDGDITIDLLKKYDDESRPEDINEEYEKVNFELYYGKSINAIELNGGALLLAEMIEKAVEKKNEVYSYNKKDINFASRHFIHTISNLAEYEPTLNDFHSEGDIRYRVESFEGFKYRDSEKLIFPKINYKNNNDKVDFVVIHDARNYYRFKNYFYRNKIFDKIGEHTLIIHKMSHPVAEGKFWKEILKFKNQMVVILLADDLRAKDLRISRSLSWERSALDLKNIMEKIRKKEINDEKLKNLKELMDCKYLIIRFGIDGAILYEKKGHKYTLFYYPESFEGDLEKKYPGKIKGSGIAFTSGLVHELQKSSSNELQKIKNGILAGFVASQKLFEWGFIPTEERELSINYTYLLFDIEKIKIKKKLKIGFIASKKLFLWSYLPSDKNSIYTTSSENELTYPYKYMFSDIEESKKKIKEAEIEHDKWKIIDKKLNDNFYKIANEIVTYGYSDKLTAPLAEFGKLVTTDRNEMESYHSIKNLINEYLNKENVNVPLSIAVFGPPGSGKSFGVSEIAKSISENIKKVDFNLSQFNSPEDLFNAFHIIQSTSLSGKTPLVFFDEFDTPLEKVPFGWLKYFLSPMNDGEFTKGETIHPIGKCIFVFAGSVKENFADFKKEITRDNNVKTDNFKGSDFISRLRGYVNTIGINKLENEEDHYMIRRAYVLRTILEKNATNIFKYKNSKKIAQIDRSVLNALLKVPKYNHGNRSLTAIVEMSMLSNKTRFDRSSLPSSEQLELHVNKNDFKSYLNNENIQKYHSLHYYMTLYPKHFSNNSHLP